MPRLVHMTWVASQKRWTKMHQGTRYYVSCKELGTEPTQAASLLAANAWWEARLDALRQPTLIDRAKKLLEDDDDYLLNLIITDSPVLPDLMEALATKDWNQVAATMLQAEPADERSIAHQAATWIGMERQRVISGKVGPDRADSNRRNLTHFVDFLGQGSTVDKINESTWVNWYGYLAKQIEVGKWNNTHANRIFSVAKRFVRFLWEMRLVELPRNLDNRQMTFTLHPQAIEVFSTEQLQALWSVLRNQSRLHFLLMLNCGMLARDISDLRQDQVDWTLGIITRKRSKTESHENVPTVRYKLWNETLEELRKWKSDDPTIVLLTGTGKRWIQDHQGDVSYSRSDSVASAMRPYLKAAKVQLPPKALRATGATLLGRHPSFKFFAQYYLGQSPRTVADKHYVKPSDAEFFEALDWLRSEVLPRKG